MKGREHNAEIQDQKTSEQTLNSMCDVRLFFRSPTPYSFVYFNTLFSLRLVPIPVGSFSHQASHDCGSSIILGQPRKARFTFTKSHNGCSELPCRDSPAMFLSLGTFLNHGGKFHYPFLIYLTLKQNLVAKTSKFCLFLELENVPFDQIHFHQFSVLIVSFTSQVWCPKILCRPVWSELRDHWPLSSKCCY